MSKQLLVSLTKIKQLYDTRTHLYTMTHKEQLKTQALSTHSLRLV